MLVDWNLDQFTINHLSQGPTCEYLKTRSSWAPPHPRRLRRWGSPACKEDPSSEGSLQAWDSQPGGRSGYALGGAEPLLEPGALAAGVPGFSQPGNGEEEELGA